MTQYVDSSALAKRYLDEAGSESARRLLDSDLDWATGNHTYVEVYRAIYRAAPEEEFRRGVDLLEDDWHRTVIVALDEELCRRAAVLATVTGTRTLDALHLAAAERAGGQALRILTFDVRLASAARSLGYTVLGC